MIHAESSLQLPRPAAEGLRVHRRSVDRTALARVLRRLRQLAPLLSRPAPNLHYAYRRGGRTGAMTDTVTACDHDSRLALQFSDHAFEVDVDVRWATAVGGIAVTHAIAITPKSFFFRLLSPLIRVGNRRQVANNLARLKAQLAPRA